MTPDEALGLLDDLDQPGKVHVTAWEGDFIDSLLKQIERDGKPPTEKQAVMLRKIHGERVKL